MLILAAKSLAGFVLNSIGFKALVYHCGAVVIGFNFTSVGDCIFGYKSQEDSIGVISVNLKIKKSKPNLALNSATISTCCLELLKFILKPQSEIVKRGQLLVHHTLNPVAKLGGPNWDR